MKKFIKKRYKLIISLLISMILVISFLDYRVTKSTQHFIFDNPDLLPYNKVGLVLGTSKYLQNGTLNEFWKNRIDAAYRLYQMKKIRYIIVSGDNSKKDYDEPTEMKNELVKLGVLDTNIFLDYAGFRTFDSMIRAEKIFSQNSFTIISQKFHNQRAVYIARHFGLNAVGFNAKDVTAYNGFKTKLREKFARVKMFMDITFHKQPKFLGEKVKLD